MPLTVGGGVRSVEAVPRLLRVGADKVSLNSAAFKTPELVTEAAAQIRLAMHHGLDRLQTPFRRTNANASSIAG